MGDKHATPKQFNPLVLVKHRTSDASTRAWIERVRGRLPKSLTESEIQRRWERVSCRLERSKRAMPT